MRVTIRSFVGLVALAFACGLVPGAAVAAEDEIKDPLLRQLVENGTLTADQARAVEAERKAAEQKERKGPKVNFGGLWYISYQDGETFSGTPDPDGPNATTDFNRFVVKRGYLNVTASLTPWMDMRFTPDVTLDSSGDLKVRMKYVYARFKAKGGNFFSKPYAEVGLAHMPWLDFEENINRYRMQDTMFMERVGLFNSADYGVMVGSNLGPDLDEAYRQEVNSHYAGRYGSWQVGIYNGGGYHASEKNSNKVLEGRLSVRPLGSMLPGLQVSGLVIDGKGNQATEPDWNVRAVMLSYESRRFVATAQAFEADGNQGGTAVLDPGVARESDGYSVFAEVRLTPRFSVIGRFDEYDGNAEDPASDETQRRIAGIAWHFYKGNVLLLDWDSVEHSNPLIPNEDRLQATLQVKF